MINAIARGFFLLSILMLSTQLLQAQDLLKGKDLSQLRVDQLSDADIAKLNAQLGSAGMSIEQAEQMAIAKGMSAVEFSKLKQRLANIDSQSRSGKLKSGNHNSEDKRTNNSGDTLSKANYRDDVPKPLINPLIFGAELYTSASPSFEPNLKIATPVNYVVGPDDQLQIAVFGVQEYSGDLLVSPEGAIAVPNIGLVKVAGMTIEAVTQKLRSIMGNSVYSSLRTGGSKLSVTIGKIRSIRVTVIGSTHPNNYTLSSLSTVYNALYVAGGPAEFGSFRQIELVRNNKVVETIDLYQLLLHGNQSGNIGLKDNDIIRIPAYKNRVEMKGQVKRPGIFEVLPGESFADILSFASGFTDTAYRASVKVYQRSEKERKLADLTSSEYTVYHPQSGDLFEITKILNRFENRVRISGAVFRPDVYSLQPGIRVADLIRKADGLKEDAYTYRGQIFRLKDDLSREIISFNIKKALLNDPEDNQLLQREDEIFISSKLDLKDSFKVIIQGEIRLPGEYDYVEKLTLKDLILQAGGFTNAAYNKIEIARLINRDSIAPTDNRASSILYTEINEQDLSTGSSFISLMPFDVITIRRKSGYLLPETVTINGQIQFPGPYVLSSRNESVSGLLKRAGGYTPDAYPEGAFLKRYKSEQDKEKAADAVKRLQKSVKDSSDNTTTEILRDFDKIPLNLIKIMKNPGIVEDIVLRARDEIVIPKFDAQVKISGEILLATQVPFQKEYHFSDYISSAGGFAPQALRRRSYVIYANGEAASTKHFLFLKFYPKIKPGSEVVIPKRADRKGASTGEMIGIASALASLAGVVIALLRL